MSEIAKEAKEEIDQIVILLQGKKDKLKQNEIKEKFFLLEKKIENICRGNFPKVLKLDLLEALKKLLKRAHFITRKK